MDVVEFLKEKKRMCDSVTDCKHCPIGEQFLPHYTNTYCCDNFCFDVKDKSLLVSKVEQWSKEHPRKTRKQDFLEKYPKATLTLDGLKMPKVCAHELGYCESCHYVGGGCYNCWNEPVED